MTGKKRKRMASNGEEVLIRVYAGGQESPQVGPFISIGHVIGQLIGKRIRQEFLYVADIRERGWSPYDLVNWLLESNYHFILTHPHQGNPRWDCSEVYAAMTDLEDHPGFPYKDKLLCPIFSQHKFRYLCAIPEIVNPTIAIPFPKITRENDSQGNIKYISYATMETFKTSQLVRFLESHNEGRGWVVKFPFVTVREGLKFCKTERDVMHALDVSAGKFGGRIPYAMVQPCLINRKEYKVVVLNGKASHVLPQDAGVRVGSKAAKAFSAFPHTDLFRFAEMAVAMLGKRCPGSHAEGLVRVDVMQTAEGNMIVNEFESLEALYMGISPSQTNDTFMFLREYWVRCVNDAFKI